MNFGFLEACGITGVLSVFLGSLFVFASMILTYSFRQVGIKKYLLIHGSFVGATLLISAAIYHNVQNSEANPDALNTCASAPIKMLLWIPAMILVAFVIHFFLRKKVRA